MDTDAMTAYYWKNLKDIPQRQLADNDEYHALIQKKIAAENALKVFISEEAWRRYLELDAISNELESVRLEAMYPSTAKRFWYRQTVQKRNPVCGRCPLCRPSVTAC